MKTFENLDIMNYSHSYKMWILTTEEAENILKKYLKNNVNIYLFRGFKEKLFQNLNNK